MREPWLIRPSNDEESGLRADLGIAEFDDMDGRKMLLDVRITDMDCPSNIKTAPPRAILHKHRRRKFANIDCQHKILVGPSNPFFVMGADGFYHALLWMKTCCCSSALTLEYVLIARREALE
jgi:hypothetical protein